MFVFVLNSSLEAEYGGTDPAFGKWKLGDQEFKVILWLHRMIRAKLGFMRPCLKNQEGGGAMLLDIQLSKVLSTQG